jgi:hypothetical protein
MSAILIASYQKLSAAPPPTNNKVPVASMTTNNIIYSANASVIPFTNVSILGATSPSGTNYKIKHIVLQLSGVTDGNNEKVIISGLEVPLVLSAANPLPSGGTYAISSIGTTRIITLANTSGFSLPNTLISTLAYKNDAPTPTLGVRTFLFKSVTDTGISGPAASQYGTNPFSAFNFTSTVTI